MCVWIRMAFDCLSPLYLNQSMSWMLTHRKTKTRYRAYFSYSLCVVIYKGLLVSERREWHTIRDSTIENWGYLFCLYVCLDIFCYLTLAFFCFCFCFFLFPRCATPSLTLQQNPLVYRSFLSVSSNFKLNGLVVLILFCCFSYNLQTYQSSFSI